MASKTHLLIFLSIAIMATSIADAQVVLPPTPIPIPNPNLPITVNVSVSGIVNCTLNSTVGAAAPPFPNATVQLQCPPGIIIATAVTNSSGGFTFNVTIPLSVPQLLNSLGSCRIVVTTPLVNCNASLPGAGSLVSTGLGLAGISINGTSITIFLKLLNLVLTAFGIGK